MVWNSAYRRKTGVTETIIKEKKMQGKLGGDKPLVSTLIMSIAVAVSSLLHFLAGSIIMVGSIVLQF